MHEWVTVTEDAIAAALRLWARHRQDPIEGAAGVGLAALLQDAGELNGQTAAVVICGGNVAQDVWERVLSTG